MPQRALALPHVQNAEEGKKGHTRRRRSPKLQLQARPDAKQEQKVLDIHERSSGRLQAQEMAEPCAEHLIAGATAAPSVVWCSVRPTPDSGKTSRSESSSHGERENTPLGSQLGFWVPSHTVTSASRAGTSPIISRTYPVQSNVWMHAE